MGLQHRRKARPRLQGASIIALLALGAACRIGSTPLTSVIAVPAPDRALGRENDHRIALYAGQSVKRGQRLIIC